MRSAIRILLSLLWAALPGRAATFSFHVEGADSSSWTEALSSLGLVQAPAADAGLVVLRAGAAAGDWAARVELGTFLIIEGASPLAESFGFRQSEGRVTVRSVIDTRAPELGIVWEEATTLPRFSAFSGARVFA